MIHISIENIPRQVVSFSDEMNAKLAILKADLNSGFVKSVESYLPETAAVIEGAKAILDTGITALVALRGLGNDAMVNGAFLTLNTQLNNLITEGVHEWSDLVTWVETAYRHWKLKV